MLYGSEIWGTFNHNVNKDLLYFFFFPIKEWNTLPNCTVTAQSPESFKAQLRH
jgi:hypothetical protein